MIEKFPELRVFSVLDHEKLSKIMDVLDENILIDQFHSSKLKNLTEMGFTPKQSRDIIQCFF